MNFTELKKVGFSRAATQLFTSQVVTGSDFSQMGLTLSVPFFSCLGKPCPVLCIHPCLSAPSLCATAAAHHLHGSAPGCSVLQLLDYTKAYTRESQMFASCLPRLSQDPKLGHFRMSSNWYFVQSSGIPFLSPPCSSSVNQWPFFPVMHVFLIMVMSQITELTWISSWLLPKLCTVVDRHLRKVSEGPPLRAGMWKVPLVFLCVWFLHLQLLLLYVYFSLCCVLVPPGLC